MTQPPTGPGPQDPFAPQQPQGTPPGWGQPLSNNPYGAAPANPYGQPSAPQPTAPAPQPSADPWQAAGAAQQNGYPQQGSYPQQGTPQQGAFPPADAQQPQGGYPAGAWQPQTGGATPVAPTTPPKKANGLLMRLLSILIAVGVAIGFGIWRANTGGGDNLPKTGACIKLAEEKDDVEWRKVDCKGESDKLAFYVASTGTGTPNCPSGDYLEYTMTDKKDKSAATEYACLIPNWQKDLCYDIDPNIPGPVACTASEADLKITGAYDGSDDESLCTAEETPSTFSMPKRTYCYTEPS